MRKIGIFFSGLDKRTHQRWGSLFLSMGRVVGLFPTPSATAKAVPLSPILFKGGIMNNDELLEVQMDEYRHEGQVSKVLNWALIGFFAGWGMGILIALWQFGHWLNR